MGLAISIDQIETILGIVILCIQICWILGKFIYSVIQKIKEKRYSEIKEDIDTVTEELQNVTNNNNGKDGKNTKS